MLLANSQVFCAIPLPEGPLPAAAIAPRRPGPGPGPPHRVAGGTNSGGGRGERWYSPRRRGARSAAPPSGSAGLCVPAGSVQRLLEPAGPSGAAPGTACGGPAEPFAGRGAFSLRAARPAKQCFTASGPRRPRLRGDCCCRRLPSRSLPLVEAALVRARRCPRPGRWRVTGGYGPYRVPPPSRAAGGAARRRPPVSGEAVTRAGRGASSGRRRR